LIPENLVVDITGQRNDNICNLKMEQLDQNPAEKKMIRKEDRPPFKFRSGIPDSRESFVRGRLIEKIY